VASFAKESGVEPTGDLADFYQLDDPHAMIDDRFWPRGFAALHPVILSVHHVRAGRKRFSRRNLGWGQRAVSSVTAAWTVAR